MQHQDFLLEDKDCQLAALESEMAETKARLAALETALANLGRTGGAQ